MKTMLLKELASPVKINRGGVSLQDRKTTASSDKAAILSPKKVRIPLKMNI